MVGFWVVTHDIVVVEPEEKGPLGIVLFEEEAANLISNEGLLIF